MENEIMNGMEQVMENIETAEVSGNNGVTTLGAVLIAGATYVGMRLGEKALKAGGNYLKARKAAKQYVIDNTGNTEFEDVEG